MALAAAAAWRLRIDEPTPLPLICAEFLDWLEQDPLHAKAWIAWAEAANETPDEPLLNPPPFVEPDLEAPPRSDPLLGAALEWHRRLVAEGPSPEFFVALRAWFSEDPRRQEAFSQAANCGEAALRAPGAEET